MNNLFGGIMKNKEVYKRALHLAVPMMIQNGITNMVSLVDNLMVGSLGTEAITGVSIAGQLIFVFNLAIFGGISGPGIYSAQFCGQRNDEGVRNAFRLKNWICLVCTLLGILIFIFGGEFLIGMYLHGESAEIDADLAMQLSKDYLMIMLWGFIPFAITQSYASSLRETGESVLPMTAGIASVAVDVVFNYLLIYGHFGFPRLGVKGAAAATVLARVVEMLIVVIYSHLKSSRFTFLKGAYRTIFVPKELAAKMLNKGLPIFFNEFLWAGGVAALTQCYSSRGLDIVPGMNISNAICNLMNVAFVALGSAVGILTGQTLGASRYEKAKSEASCLMRFSALVSAALAVGLIAISGVFPQFYKTSDSVRSLASHFIVITALFFPVQGYLNALYFTLRSGGKTLVTFLFDSAYSWAVVVPLAYLLCRFSPLGIFTVYILVQSADIIKIIIGSFLFRRDFWISNIVEDTKKLSDDISETS